MASVDAAGDPLHAAASATCLLLRTLGPAASAASPSRCLGALLDGPLKGSKELVEQARLMMKEHQDFDKLYQEDGAKVAAAANGKNNQQGRRPALDRKRARFTLKALPSNTVQNVDFSQLSNIEDPDEYFSTLEQLEKADKEIKKLRGEVPTKTTDHLRAIEPPKKRPGMSRRKSAHSYKFSVGAHSPDVTEAPSSQTGTIMEPQFTQDDIPASVPEKITLPVPPSSSQCDIPNISTIKDSFAEKDTSVTWDNLMSEFKKLDESEEENLLREKLQLKEISIGGVCLPDLFNIPADRPIVSTTVQENPTSGHTPERAVLGGHHDRISQWEKRIFDGDILKDKTDLSKDDESDSSPETVRSKQSMILMAGEASAASETPRPNFKSPDHILEPESSIPNGVSRDGREPGNSSPDAYIYSEVAKEKGASSRHNVSLGEDAVPIDYPITEKPNQEPEVSSPHHLEGNPTEMPHHLEGNPTEMLGSTPGRNASALPDTDANFEHQGVGGKALLQDKSTHPPEIPPEDIDPNNQSHIDDGNIQKQAVDISNELSLSKDGKRKAVRSGKNKKQSAKRGKIVADEASHPLEMPPVNFDPENQPGLQDINVEEVVGGNDPFQDRPIHTSETPAADIHPHNQSRKDDGNMEKRAVDVSNELSLSKGSKQKTARNGKTKKQPSKRGKRAADKASYPLGVPPSNCDSETQPNLQDTNIEQQIVSTSDPRSPNKGKGEKEVQRKNKRKEYGRKSLTGFGLAWQSGVRRSTRIRSRPLEDWRGERFLYGRIHDTMATVIGIKSYSPGQDGKTAMKVKSFVPEQYSDIVAQAAKY